MARSVLLAWLLAAPLAALAAEAAAPQPEVALADLVREALRANPEIAQAEQRVWMMRARVPQAGALPDPTLTTGVINEGRPVPFETVGTKDFSEVYAGFTQEIPFPGKRGLREEAARGDASAERFVYETTRRRVIAELADRYYELHATRGAAEILAQSLALMDQWVGVSRQRFAVGQGSQRDVLEAEVELSRLEERRSLLDQQRQLLEAAIARLLGRGGAQPLGPLAALAPTPVAEAQEAVLAQAERASPWLQEQDARVAAASQRLALARRDRLPDFGLELVYHDRGRRDLDPFYTLGATVTLPVYASRKQEQAIEEAAAALRAARSAAAAARAELRFAVTSAYLNAKTSERLLRLYDEGLLQQSRLVVDASTAQYQVGRADFATVIAGRRRLLEDQIAYRQQQAAHEKAAALLAIYMGAPALVPAAALPEDDR